MKKIQYLYLFGLLALTGFLNQGCNTEERPPKLEAIKYEQLFDIIKAEDDKLYVVNFWATWCRPCMKEMPGFLAVDSAYRRNDNYQMILVSLDKSSALNAEVKSVVQTMKMKPDVYLLDDVKRMNTFITALNGTWSGSIPATALYKNGIQLEFHEGEMTKLDLEQLIKKHI